MKVFLSHNMRGKTGLEVHIIRERAKNKLIEEFGEDIEIIDNYNHSGPTYNDANRLWHLGASVQQMGEADGIYFCYPDDTNNGCKVEKYICELYGLRVLNDEMKR